MHQADVEVSSGMLSGIKSTLNTFTYFFKIRKLLRSNEIIHCIRIYPIIYTIILKNKNILLLIILILVCENVSEQHRQHI